MNQVQLKNIVEAALMVSEKPVSLNQLLAIFEKESDIPEKTDIKAAINQLIEDYKGRGIELKEVSSGFRVQVNSDYADWINHLFDDRPPKYSRALMETLAIIAYRQPITRAEIEDIRGVSVSSNIIRTLQERSWIRVVGQRDVPGKPELLATTKEFLDYFNLKMLSELPSLAEIKDFDQINPDLFDELEKEAQVEINKVQVNKAATDTSEAAMQESDTEQAAKTDVDDRHSEDDANKSDTKHNVVSDEDNVVPFG